MSPGSVSFVAPWLLVAFTALPLIWWLLRLIPPKALKARFPAVRLLEKLVTREQSPAKSPPWLLVLRISLVGAVILGLAQPLFNAVPGLSGNGPLILVIDDGWAAAADWPGHRRAVVKIINQAKRANRAVIIVSTAIQSKSSRPLIRPLSADEAIKVVRYMQPKPWFGDRAAALAALDASGVLGGNPPGQVIWFSDGLDDGANTAFIERLKRIGKLTVVSDDSSRLPIILMAPENQGGALKITAMRAGGGPRKVVWLKATGEGGRLLARQAISFANGENKAETRLDLPAELRNRLDRLRIEGESTAAAVALIDERWRRRPVGLATWKGGADASSPLLSQNFYIERALEPFSEIRRGPPEELVKRKLAVLVMADPGHITPANRDIIGKWVEKGGVLLRFVGPRMAETGQTEDRLLPVRLRPAARSMGGSMTWEKPAKLARFNPKSPFRGLKIPGDIRVRRQLLAQPSVDLADRTWASLSDGTPLVTAAKKGNGWIVLVHTTANAEWSDLALSGLFVKMLQRVVRLGAGVAAKADGQILEPLSSLDGSGRLTKPPATALAIAADALAAQSPGPSHPPGFYGKSSSRRALNLSGRILTLDPLVVGKNISGADHKTYAGGDEVNLKPWLLGLAMVLAVIDLAASLVLRGLLAVRTTVGVAIAVLVLSGGAAGAATADDFAMAAGLETRLAYVITGNSAIDETSRAGLKGLSQVIRQRTAVELGQPMAVNPETDDLVFFPLLYWPLTITAADISDTAVSRLNSYMRGGGTILFDTREGRDGGLPAKLEKLASRLDIGPLSPIPPGHVLGRSFYLLDEFPGRWSGATLWLNPSGERTNDGVSRVIVGANDWAAAWAVDDALRPLFAAVPGGERQREMAYRFGINLVMYTLTGNYKSDQVHLKAIIERLGR